MSQLKVGFVLDDTLDSADGVQQYILTIGGWLARQGYEVHYLVGSSARTDMPNIHSLGRNIKVRFNGNRMSTPLPASRRKLRQLLADEAFDIVHVQMPYSPFLAGRIVQEAPPSTAVVGTFHILPYSGLVRLSNKLLSIGLKRSLARFQQVMSVSQAAADFARTTYNIDSVIIPNAIEISKFAAAEPFAVTDDKLTLVTVGRLVPRKGCRILLEALKILKDASTPPLRLIICGRGPLEPELKQYVATAGLTEWVEFTGFVTEADKARYLKTADIAVYPSTGGECFGIVLIEAMAAGHPVVLGADNPGYASVLGPYPDLLFPVHNPAALARTLQEYIGNAAKRHQARQWQSRYVGQFDAPVVGEKITKIYAEALRGAQGVR